LNYRFKNFKGFKKFDLNSNEGQFHFVPSMSVSTIKKEIVLDNKIEFENIIPVGEDSVFMAKLLMSLEKKDVVFINTNKYFYRKRQTNDSSLQSYKKDKTFFIEYLKNYYLNLLNYKFYDKDK
jgi:hypothetical protein